MFHGLNPGMGWLFAVALGMQEGDRRAVWGSLTPLAVGHALAIAAALVVAALIGQVIPIGMVRTGVAVVLIAFGSLQLIRQRHPRYGGMRMSHGQLTLWSFLMATAHGAGLMVLPFVLSNDAVVAHSATSMAQSSASAALVTLVHTGAYLLTTVVIAVVVYERVGVAFLRQAWLNVDLVWALALIATGVFTLLI